MGGWIVSAVSSVLTSVVIAGSPVLAVVYSVAAMIVLALIYVVTVTKT